MKFLVAIVGPTAVGKSALALSLAQRLEGEIINADSRQVYRYMDIGTAKPSPQERALVPQHLIDIVDPDEEFSLALYQEMAYEAISNIRERGKLPLLVGGSGLYVKAVIEGWRVPPVAPSPQLRRSLEERAQREGGEALYRELAGVDPEAARKIDPRNLRRIIRALEVFELAGTPYSQLQQCGPAPFPTLIIGLTTDRQDLYRRIDSRVDEMIRRGLVEEVRGLVERGYSFHLPSMSSLGYKEIGLYLQGELDLPDAVQRIKFATHRFARHQYGWFRLQDERIQWFHVGEGIEEKTEKLLKSALKNLVQQRTMGNFSKAFGRPWLGRRENYEEVNNG